LAGVVKIAFWRSSPTTRLVVLAIREPEEKRAIAKLCKISWINLKPQSDRSAMLKLRLLTKTPIAAHFRQPP
jgi:hypothetical protein